MDPVAVDETVANVHSLRYRTYFETRTGLEAYSKTSERREKWGGGAALDCPCASLTQVAVAVAVAEAEAVVSR